MLQHLIAECGLTRMCSLTMQEQEQMMMLQYLFAPRISLQLQHIISPKFVTHYQNGPAVLVGSALAEGTEEEGGGEEERQMLQEQQVLMEQQVCVCACVRACVRACVCGVCVCMYV
jgi:hypothetical protein